MNSTTVNTALVNVDVLILGAGAAGLTAAYDLHFDSDQKYRILEASSGLGGRLQKLTGFADFPIDIGGEWIHAQPDVLDNITADPTQNATDYIDTVAYAETYDEYDEGQWVTMNFDREDYKFVNFTWFDFFNDYIALDDVVENLELNCQVDFIDWSASPVEVNCADGRQWTANQVIVTVPIKILQDNDILFQPALPQETREAVDKYEFIPGLKVFMKFENRFYKEAFEFATDYDGIEEGSSSGRYFYSVAYGQDTQQNVLGIFAVGEIAKKFLNLTNDEIFESILEQLDGVYDGQATVNFLEGFVRNWNDQPFVRGAYTDLDENEEAWGAIEELREPLADRIFFAGEAIPPYTLEYGNAHGAAFSGRAAAEKVMDLIDTEVTFSTGDTDFLADTGGQGSGIASAAMTLGSTYSVLSFGALFLVCYEMSLKNSEG